MDKREHPIEHSWGWGGPGFMHACDWSIHGGRHFGRHFQSKAEQIAELEAYLNDLKAEVKAVEEHLADLRR